MNARIHARFFFAVPHHLDLPQPRVRRLARDARFHVHVSILTHIADVPTGQHLANETFAFLSFQHKLFRFEISAPRCYMHDGFSIQCDWADDQH